jgi:hypothetical protein
VIPNTLSSFVLARHPSTVGKEVDFEIRCSWKSQVAFMVPLSSAQRRSGLRAAIAAAPRSTN